MFSLGLAVTLLVTLLGVITICNQSPIKSEYDDESLLSHVSFISKRSPADNSDNEQLNSDPPADEGEEEGEVEEGGEGEDEGGGEDGDDGGGDDGGGDDGGGGGGVGGGGGGGGISEPLDHDKLDTIAYQIALNKLLKIKEAKRGEGQKQTGEVGEEGEGEGEEGGEGEGGGEDEGEDGEGGEEDEEGGEEGR